MQAQPSQVMHMNLMHIIGCEFADVFVNAAGPGRPDMHIPEMSPLKHWNERPAG